MSLVDNGNNGLIMPVAPMGGYGFGGGGSGFGDGFGSGWWVILVLFALMGNWGNGFGGGFGGGNNFFPWMFAGQSNMNNDVQRGFDQSAIMSGINGISSAVTSGFGDVQNALCNGFSQAEIAANARQIADMQQAFASQTAITAGMNNISAGLQNCCCENRAATADLKYTVATEACADRAAISSALRDVLEANTASTQRILDQLCQDKIDSKNEKIADLERQLTMANLAASQTAQTSRILADNAAQTVALEQYLNPAPIPAYVVQNPNCCGNYNYGGCGCGVA